MLYDITILKSKVRSAKGKNIISSAIFDIEMLVNDHKTTAKVVMAFSPRRSPDGSRRVGYRLFMDKTIKKSKETAEIKRQMLEEFKRAHRAGQL